MASNLPNMNVEYEQLLKEHGIRPTANRLLIAATLANAAGPLTMTEIEDLLETIDKSNIFRTLSLFHEHHLVHVIETGNVVHYEMCRSSHGELDEDTHVHFYCERCHRTFCFDTVSIPAVAVPDGYQPHTFTYVISGLCGTCRQRMK